MQSSKPETRKNWLSIKASSYRFVKTAKGAEDFVDTVDQDKEAQHEPLFNNPFQLEDLSVFDDATMREMLRSSMHGLGVKDLATGLQGAAPKLTEKVLRNLTYRQRAQFLALQQARPKRAAVKAAQKQILDSLFWELTYWKTPELYEELTEGENLHPGIFRSLKTTLSGKTVLDAGAGSGRACFECLRDEAKQVFALEPSPGLLHLLEQKLVNQPKPPRIIPLRGRFDNIPIENNSVDVALACSAFTAESAQGGEQGLSELQRVTRAGGKVVIIWPRPEDYDWLAAHGFNYVAMPLRQEMQVRFRSLEVARRCAQRFYARNSRLLRYLHEQKQPTVPFSVLGFNPPHDYCWLEVKK